MIYSLGLLADVGEAISYAFRVLCGRLATIIYDFIIIVYDLFMYIAKAQILDNDFVSEIYEKVGLILGLFMVFKLIFSLIQSLIDPKKINDKKNGVVQVIYRMILAIVMLGIVPTIFREAFKVQDLLVGGSNGNNVIYKLIVGDTIAEEDISFGRTIATELYFSFYSDLDDPKLSESVDLDDDGFGPISTNQVEKVRERIEMNDESFSIAEEYLGHRINNRYYIEFNEIFILIVGIAVLWILIMYCIQVAVRVFQLAYLQLIAPIPILSYISNPEGSFQKWIKQCTATYLDLFIRLAIIYFVMDLSVYVLEQINDAGSVLSSSLGNISEGTKTWVVIFLLIGLLLFAKKVPELIKDLGLFPTGAGKFSFGLNPKKEVFEPLKNLYNNTPLGWAPKALGTVGKKTIGAIDRKIHHLTKPRNKFQQYMDKLAPGHAEVVKNRNQARNDARRWDEQNRKGKEIYDRVAEIDGKPKLDDANGKVKNGVFRNQEYINSWNVRNSAKKKVKEANEAVEKLQREVSAVYNDSRLSGVERQRAIEIAEQRLKNAKGNLSAAEGELKIADDHHKKNQAIYRDDARTETLFNNYADTHKEQNDINKDVDVIEARYNEELENMMAEVKRRESVKANADNAQKIFNELNGIDNVKASENGAPTEAKSAIAEKYKQEDEKIQSEAQKRMQQQKQIQDNIDKAQSQFNQLNGVSSSQGNGPKVTAENSLFVQLDQEAKREKEAQKQKQMQEEFKNRKPNE